MPEPTILFANDLTTPPLECPISRIESQIAAARGIKRFSWADNLCHPDGRAISEELAGAPLNFFVIRNMNTSEHPNLGFGVFAAQTIPAGTIIGSYSGDYVRSSRPGDVYQVVIKGQGSNDAVVSAFKRGNITGLIQHSPEPGLGVCYDPCVLCANLETRVVFDTLFLVANCDIEKGVMLAWDYGKKYWSALGLEPKFFSSKGEVLDCLGLGHAGDFLGMLMSMAEIIGNNRYVQEQTLACSLLKEKYLRYRGADGDVLMSLQLYPNALLRHLTVTELDILTRYCSESVIAIGEAEVRETQRKLASQNLHCLFGYLEKFHPQQSERASRLPPGVACYKYNIRKALAEAAPAYPGQGLFIPIDNPQKKSELQEIVDTSYRRGMECFKRKNFIDAIRFFSEALTILPNISFGPITTSLRRLSFRNHLYLLTPNIRALYWNLGNAFLGNNDLKRAHYCLEIAVEMARQISPEVLEKYRERFNEVKERLKANDTLIVPAAASASSAAPSHAL